MAMAVDSSGGNVVASPAQPSKSPAGDQILDSAGRKACHQCRQKIKNFGVACNNQRKNKPCSLQLCHKCLLNRYGEIAEEVALVEDWICPKCRGICNCSVCMKKRGHQPTGPLTTTAKANGFSSVSEMLVKGDACVNHDKVGAPMAASPKKEGVTSPRKSGKENSFDGKVDANVANSVEKKSSKKVRKARNDIVGDSTSSKISSRGHKRDRKKEGSDNIQDHNSNVGRTGLQLSEKKRKKMKCDKTGEKGTNNGRAAGGTGLQLSEKKRKKMKCDKAGEMGTNNGRASASKKDSARDNDSTINGKNFLDHQFSDSHVEITLPVGMELTSVAGIDVWAEDIGNALQFLEFCSVFGKILGIRKGQPENVLQELFHGRASRRGKYSLSVQFHNHLLSVLQPEHEENSETESPIFEKSTWLQTLKECLSKSKSVRNTGVLDFLEKAADYDALDASEKLRVLNILCDEILGTKKVRCWIDDQNKKFAEQVKETEKKEKSLKQKMKNGIDKAIPTGDDFHSISEQVETSHDQMGVAQDQADVLESKDMLLRDNQSSDAIRSDPIFLDCRGHAFWILNCLGKSDILDQNIGKGDDTLTLNEKWFALDAEGKEVIEKHVRFLRQTRRPSGI